jgi:hypothetical protein
MAGDRLEISDIAWQVSFDPSSTCSIAIAWAQEGQWRRYRSLLGQRLEPFRLPQASLQCPIEGRASVSVEGP